MNNILKFSTVALCVATTLTSCSDSKPDTPSSKIEFKAHSKTPNFLKVEPAFSNVKVYPVLSSEDKLEETPNFLYGSMADGAGLLKNTDGTYTLINNIEADFSIARIKFDETFKPMGGEYILNASATARTAQCSGSLITQEEHNFGPLYLSGGEWGGSSKAVFVTNPYKSPSAAGSAKKLTALGEWSTENAVAIGKDAYPDKTVVFIGDDTGADDIPRGDLGIYVGNQGDLENGKLYGLKVTNSEIKTEVDMKEGTSYEVEFVELTEKTVGNLEKECRAKGVIAFSRVEDIDWRRGSGAANREVYFCVTGRLDEDGNLRGKGTLYGRVYKLELNATSPTGKAKLTCVLDGDKTDGKANMFKSPDNITVTKNYAYIQEDPNGNTADRSHFASLYQYNLKTGELKKVLECDQEAAFAKGYGVAKSSHYKGIKSWEITGMIDISDIVGVEGSFMVITQNHGWVPKDGGAFTDPDAIKVEGSNKEGSVLHVITGLER